MQRQAWIASAILIAVVAFVGLMITLVGENRKETADTTKVPGAAAPAETPATPGARVEAPAAEPATNRVEPFAFRRLEVDTAKAQAEACLVFTAPLDESGKTKYEDYVVLAPAVDAAIRPQGNRLCVAGLAFNSDYQATLRAGLPSARGEKLAADEAVPVALRDRPPLVAFGEGFILPRNASDGLPVTTVNVKAIDVRILRVSDRLLGQLRADIVDDKVIYGYDVGSFTNDQGREVWTGSMDVSGPTNEPVTTLIPLRQALGTRDPGVYIVVASDAADRESVGDTDQYYWKGKAAQWVIDTDLGLTSYRGEDGLTVFVRSLAQATPEEGIEIALVARDNSELGRARTDRQGIVRFPPALLRGRGGAEPIVAMAYGKAGDFAFLDLRRPAFDLTDRGVEGRASPGPVDAYLYTDRGIYRGGETVELVAMVRDREARALADVPLTLVMTRPDGLEYRREQVKDLAVGAAHLALPLTPTAPRGRWSVQAFLDKNDAPLGRVEFDVQDFVPERLKLVLAAKTAPLAPGDTFNIGIDARFLYGAPAANLSGEGELRLVPASEPFPQYKDYRFGLVEESFQSDFQQLQVAATDAAGKGSATGVVNAGLVTTLPLDGKVRISMFEPGGRTTSEEVTLPVRAGDLYLGMRPLFENDEVAENAEARFELVALDRSGKPVSRTGLRYEIVREEVDYQWYQLNGEWRFETITRDRLLSTGTVSIGADKPASLTTRVEWGAYRVTVREPGDRGAATSTRFYAGWGGGGSEDRPDRIAVAADQGSYKVGDKAKVLIRPPIAGKALVVIASDRIHTSRLVDVPKDGTEVSVDVSPEWGPGAYALVTLYRPMDKKAEGGRQPVRAIGLTWLGVDTSDRALAVTIGGPDVVRPRTTVEVPLQVTNARPGEDIRLTLAAVDEGILQLTDFESPAPLDHYFGKRRLGMDIRDDYGRLIEVENARLGTLRAGGDSLGGRGLSAVPTRTVALFSGLLTPDKSGKVLVPLAIPDFVGELRLMAVAVGGARLGEASRPFTVRDPVVAELSLPRFLAPGDEAMATLLLDNVEGKGGLYKAALSATGAVGAKDAKPIEAALSPGSQRSMRVPITAGDVGLATLSLAVEGPEGIKFTRAWPIEVRAPALPDYRQAVAVVQPGGQSKLDKSLIQGLRPETVTLTVAVANRRGADVPSLLKWLDRYPFGCLEQTTSRAMPLLYVNALAQSAGLRADEPAARRVQESVERVVDMQSWTGGFTMWGPRGDAADPWLAVFAVDFLAEAKARNYVVPQAALDKAYGFLRQLAGQDFQPDGARAYALYVLARNGQVPVADVRYFYDTARDRFSDAVGPGFAAAALAELGDRARAADGFSRARALAINANNSTYKPLSYGSLLRDVAAVTTLSASTGEKAELPQLMERMASLEPPIELTTTQEKAWLVRAAAALDQAAQGLKVDIKGAKAQTADAKSVAFAPSLSELDQGVTLTNNGSEPVWWTLTAAGTPTVPPPASANGFTIDKRYYTLTGAPANLGAVSQNDRIVVVISGVATENVFRNVALLDLLPAGFEIEAVVEPLPNGGSPYPFLTNLTSLQAAESRDDRFAAAFNLGDREPDPEGKRALINPAYTVAYIARAVTPGRFVLPGAHIEDMYRPAIQANTAAGTLVVVGAN